MGAQVCSIDQFLPNPAAAAEIKEQLRAALQKFPAAVTVIAARAESGEFYATTATAVTILTMDPPTMLCCLNRTSTIAQHLEKCSHYSINVLRADQRQLADACAGGLPHEERERIATWSDSASGAPVFAAAQSSIVCRRSQFTAYGTHDLLFGEVVGVQVGEETVPLLYLNRTYGSFQPLKPD